MELPPTASIVIPAYNAANFVQEAIRSAQEQTLKDVEIIVVDDCSTDATWDIVQAAAARDPRILPLRRTRRGGPSAACNDGFDRASGHWIALLDADDLFLPERMERLITLAEKWGADLIADNLLRRDFATGTDLGMHFPDEILTHEGPLTLSQMLQRDMPDQPTHAKLGFVQPIKRRDFLRRNQVRFAEDIGAGEDFLFYYECVARGARFHLTPEAYYVYRVRQGSVSNSRSAIPHFSAANRRMLRLSSGLGDPEVMRLLRHRQRMLDYSSFVHAVDEGRFLDALRYAHCGTPARLMAHLRILAVAWGLRRGAGPVPAASPPPRPAWRAPDEGLQRRPGEAADKGLEGAGIHAPSTMR